LRFTGSSRGVSNAKIHYTDYGSWSTSRLVTGIQVTICTEGAVKLACVKDNVFIEAGTRLFGRDTNTFQVNYYRHEFRHPATGRYKWLSTG
jgi:hypothetical protein